MTAHHPAPRYCDLAPRFRVVCDALGWDGGAIVNPADHVAQAVALVEYMVGRGFLIVHVDEVGAVPPVKPWRWSRRAPRRTGGRA